MTRTTAALTSVIAILAIAFTAVPASASDGYESIAAITGPTESSSHPGGEYESVSAITGPTESSSHPGGEYESVSAISGPTETQPSPQGSSSLASLEGPVQTPAPSIEVRESSGFDWGDALVGALVTMALALMAFGSARLIAQRRSTTVESQA